MQSRSRFLLPVAAGVVTALVYLPALRNGFVTWDDGFIRDNPVIRSLDGNFFRWAFAPQTSNWYPLTWISHAVDYALWGLDPFGHHLTNIILHAVTTALVALLAMQVAVLKAGARSGYVLTASAVAGLLFGIHPIHVESVAWIAQRKDVLCGLFFLLSLVTYLRYVKSIETSNASSSEGFRSSYGWYLLCLFFSGLALMSKPMAITLPLVFLLADWYPLERLSRGRIGRVFFEKVPFFAAGLGIAAVTFSAQQMSGAMGMSTVLPWSTRALVAAKAYAAYAAKMILPVGLSPFYPYPADVRLLSTEYLLPVVTILGVTMLSGVMLLAKGQKIWLAAWGYYVVTLLPVIGLIQVGRQAMADRYMYLPSVSLCLLVGVLAGLIISGRPPGRTQRVGRIAAALTAGAALLILLSLTLRQIPVWKDGISLWSRAVGVSEASDGRYRNRYVAFINLGFSYRVAGRFQESVEPFSRALADPFMSPMERAVCSYFRAFAYAKVNRPDLAMEDFRKAVSIDPSGSDRTVRYAVYYAELAQALLEIGESGRALEVLDTGISNLQDRGGLALLRESVLGSLGRAGERGAGPGKGLPR